MGYCSSTVYCLALASTGYCSSTVDFLQLLHATVHPPSTSSGLHQRLFTTVSCSSTLHWPPRPGSCLSSSNGLLLLPRGPIHPTPTWNCSSNPNHVHLDSFNQPPRSMFIKRQQVRLTSVSSSSEGIARLGSFYSEGSINRSGSVT